MVVYLTLSIRLIIPIHCVSIPHRRSTSFFRNYSHYTRYLFDVKQLFTSIPIQLALDCTETAITNSTHERPLPKDIMDLLKLCLTCSFFQHNGTTNNYTAWSWAHRFRCCGRNRHAEHQTTSHVQTNTATLVTLR